jgi:hypothetical protein
MGLKVVSVAMPPATGPIQLTVDDLWSSVGSPNVKPIQKGGMPVRNAIPWQFNTDYWFVLEFHAGKFRIEVQDKDRKVLESWSIADDTYKGGKFGFYNFSQGPVVYATFRKRATPVACSNVAP